MDILQSFEHVPEGLRRAVIAIGNFDGVHRGHQAVLGRAKAVARELHAKVGVMLFDPHPRTFFQPDKTLFALTPMALKLDLLKALGIDLAVVLPFDRSLASLTAEDFIVKVLVEGLGVVHVVVGYDFNFGQGRAGTPDLLKVEGAERGFSVTVVAPEGEGKTAFSSSSVRALLREGDVEKAARQLGYWWRVRGVVIGGAGRGHGLGFPTANITLAAGQELAYGIYAVRVYLTRECIAGAAYLGTRPTFDNGEAVLEVFLFDFDRDIYGSQIEVEFLRRIRDDERFESPDALSAQISKDCNEAQQVVAEVAQNDPLAKFAISARRGASTT